MQALRKAEPDCLELKPIPGLCQFVMLALALFAPVFAYAQPPVVPPDAVEQFHRVVGSRIEAMTVLGGDIGAVGGFYTFRGGSNADVNITKIGGGGMVASPRPLGVGDFKWAPVLQGNLGYALIGNNFTKGYLQGNSNNYTVYVVQAGGGARFFFTDSFSLAPAFSGILGHIINEFIPSNANGDWVKENTKGTYVDWNTDTWSIVPSLDLRYTHQFRGVNFEFRSRYSFFHTESFESSSVEVDVVGDSSTWENKLNLDVPLGWMLFKRELHTGGFFSVNELFGDIADGMNENRIYTVNGRFVLDVLGKIYKTRWVGVGSSFFWGEHFSGWSAGVDLRLQF